MHIKRNKKIINIKLYFKILFTETVKIPPSILEAKCQNGLGSLLSKAESKKSKGIFQITKFKSRKKLDYSQ
jgi:hypothetical protein